MPIYTTIPGIGHNQGPPLDWVAELDTTTIAASLVPEIAAGFAREQLAEAQQQNKQALGEVPPHVVEIDGRAGLPFEAVKIPGLIIATFMLEAILVRTLLRGIWKGYKLGKKIGKVGTFIGKRFGEREKDDVDYGTLQWIAQKLIDSSPVVSGDYRDHHTLFGDGEVIATANDIVSGADIPNAKTYYYSNPVPYARRLEVGVTKSGRAFVIQVPPHIYERVANEASGKFDNADIRFAFATIAKQDYVIQGGLGKTLSRRYMKGGRSKKRSQRDVGQKLQSPCIFIKFK